MELFDRPSLFAGFARLNLQPAGKLVGEGVQLARPVQNLELRLYRAGAQIFADRIPRQSRPTRYLQNRNLIPSGPASDDAQ